MKNLIPLTFAVIAVFTGCHKEICRFSSETRTPSGFKGETEEFADTKTYLDENNNIRWSDKDQVIIFAGTTAGGKYEVTEESVGETSADYDFLGTVSNGFVSGTDITSNVAFYPFQSIIKCAKADSQTPTQSFTLTNINLPAEQTYQDGSFSSGSFPMVAVTSSKDDMLLRFRNVCGGIKLNIQGDVKVRYITLKGNDNEPLAGTASVKAYVNGDNPVVTMSERAESEITLDCGTDGVQLNTSGTTSFIISVPPTDFKNGFSVSIADTRGYKMDLKTSAQNKVTRSNLLRMPDISYKANGTAPITDPENIAVSETANSYIVSKGGSYSIPAVKGNSSESIGEAVSAEVLWESFGTDSAPAEGDLIIASEYSEGRILFRVNDDFKEGNAVIAAKDAEGTILWSWHIWLVEDEIIGYEYGLGAGTMMDRNLGATSAVPGEDGTAGLMYQYGRKDPFLSNSAASGKKAQSSVTWPEKVSITETGGTIGYAVANPMTYITATPDEKYRWYDGTDDENKSLWQSDKTVYDPCPAGWRIPDGGAEGVWRGGEFIVELDTNKGISIKVAESASTWYPACGFINCAGTMAHFGERGCYWSTFPGISFNHTEGQLSLEAGAFVDGYSVRCFKIGSGK